MILYWLPDACRSYRDWLQGCGYKWRKYIFNEFKKIYIWQFLNTQQPQGSLRGNGQLIEKVKKYECLGGVLGE